MIKVLLAGEQDIVRVGLKMLLDTDPGIHVIAEAKNRTEIFEVIAQHPVDVIVTDMNSAELDQYEFSTLIKKNHAQVKVLLISPVDIDFNLADIFKYNADGYLLKNIEVDELLFAVKQVYKGFNYFSLGIVEKMYNFLSMTHVSGKDDTPLIGDTFSSRELEVLQLISEGYTNMEMADKLFLSKRTVEGHRQSLLFKANVKNTASLIRYAVINRLVQ
ncbi:MAG: response regulator transcription factor [Pedobacter sp.]|nr:MAG: response regulator transcription factor [Pedobacter sp.]